MANEQQDNDDWETLSYELYLAEQYERQVEQDAEAWRRWVMSDREEKTYMVFELIKEEEKGHELLCEYERFIEENGIEDPYYDGLHFFIYQGRYEDPENLRMVIAIYQGLIEGDPLSYYGEIEEEY